MGQSLRVVHLLTSLNPGGIATYVRHLLPYLASEGVQNTLVLTLDRGLLADIMEEQGYPVHLCLQHGRKQLAWSYRAGKLVRRSAALTFQARLARLLRQLEPDVVHSHAHTDQWGAQLRAAHQADAPLLLTLHSPSSPYPRRWQARRIFAPGLCPGDRLVGVSASVCRAYGGFLASLPAQNVAYPGEGISSSFPDPGPKDPAAGEAIRAALQIPPGTLVIGSVGRLIDHKRYGDLLDAATALGESAGELHILLVGDGGARQNLEQQAARLGLGERVHFAGFQSDPLGWLDAMDIYVLPSLFEGLGIATLEAMARGLAFVGTDVPATNELVSHEETGLLVPVGDAAALASAIQRLAGSPELRRQIGERARAAFLSRHTVDQAARSYLRLYDEMVSDWRAGHRQGNRYAP